MAYVGLDVVSDYITYFPAASIYSTSYTFYTWQVEPSLQMGQQFTVKETQQVFQVDSLMSSHAMSMPVKERNDINGLFDSIPYAKGKLQIMRRDER